MPSNNEINFELNFIAVNVMVSLVYMFRVIFCAKSLDKDVLHFMLYICCLLIVLKATKNFFSSA